MESISSNESDREGSKSSERSDDSSSGNDSRQENSLNCSATRSVFLVTYSQSNLQKFPLRTDFAMAVVDSFTQGSAKVLHWCCSLENHSDGGQHYHMVLKLDRVHRWLPSKKFLLQTFGINVHYSNIHHNYFSAWRYVTKSDIDYTESVGHPDLRNAEKPKTSKASIEKQKCAGKRRKHTTNEPGLTSNGKGKKGNKR